MHRQQPKSHLRCRHVLQIILLSQGLTPLHRLLKYLVALLLELQVLAVLSRVHATTPTPQGKSILGTSALNATIIIVCYPHITKIK